MNSPPNLNSGRESTPALIPATNLNIHENKTKLGKKEQAYVAHRDHVYFRKVIQYLGLSLSNHRWCSLSYISYVHMCIYVFTAYIYM